MSTWRPAWATHWVTCTTPGTRARASGAAGQRIADSNSRAHPLGRSGGHGATVPSGHTMCPRSRPCRSRFRAPSGKLTPPGQPGLLRSDLMLAEATCACPPPTIRHGDSRHDWACARALIVHRREPADRCGDGVGERPWRSSSLAIANSGRGLLGGPTVWRPNRPPMGKGSCPTPRQLADSSPMSTWALLCGYSAQAPLAVFDDARPLIRAACSYSA